MHFLDFSQSLCLGERWVSSLLLEGLTQRKDSWPFWEDMEMLNGSYKGL